MADQLSQRVITGARGKAVINDVEVGYMTDITVTINYQNAYVEVCGTPIAPAIAALGVTVDVSIGMIRLTGPDEDSVAKGLVPKFNAKDIVKWPEFDIIIQDAVDSDATLGKVIGNRIASETLQMTARGLAGKNVRFQAREYKHPSDS